MLDKVINLFNPDSSEFKKSPELQDAIYSRLDTIQKAGDIISDIFPNETLQTDQPIIEPKALPEELSGLFQEPSTEFLEQSKANVQAVYDSTERAA